MKISNFSKVSATVEKYNQLATRLAMVSAGEVMISFGDANAPSREWFTVAATTKVAEELRERVRSSIILEMEKLKSELEELGVEL